MKHHRYQPDNVDIVSLESSNATESDLPGSGRTLGKVYDFLGKRLERALGALAERKGLGPQRIAERIYKRDNKLSAKYKLYSVKIYGTEELNDQTKDFKKLLKYTRYIKTSDLLSRRINR